MQLSYGLLIGVCLSRLKLNVWRILIRIIGEQESRTPMKKTTAVKAVHLRGNKKKWPGFDLPTLKVHIRLLWY